MGGEKHITFAAGLEEEKEKVKDDAKERPQSRDGHSSASDDDRGAVEVSMPHCQSGNLAQG